MSPTSAVPPRAPVPAGVLAALVLACGLGACSACSATPPPG